MNDQIKDLLSKGYEEATDKIAYINELKTYVFENLSDLSHNPVDNVIWVPMEQVVANNYNPNSVATNEMKLLHTSISHDGYTQPVVTVYDEEQKKYVIVDGFHRNLITRHYEDIREKNHGMLPIVVISKSINDRMASTVRHNRARGKHSIAGMSDMVFQMLQNGWKDEAICNELGLEPDELLRLKHITGFSKLFEGVEYGKAWETDHQVKLKKDYENTTANS